MLSATLGVMAIVLVLYGYVASTSVIRSWSKKIWPVWEEVLPARVLLESKVPL